MCCQPQPRPKYRRFHLQFNVIRLDPASAAQGDGSFCEPRVGQTSGASNADRQDHTATLPACAAGTRAGPTWGANDSATGARPSPAAATETMQLLPIFQRLVIGTLLRPGRARSGGQSCAATRPTKITTIQRHRREATLAGADRLPAKTAFFRTATRGKPRVPFVTGLLVTEFFPARPGYTPSALSPNRPL
jgi:hypothetical protein